MTKVCHMTSAHGVEDVRIFNKECTSLAKAGYEVYLIERGNSYEKNNVHIIGVGQIPNSRWKRMTKGAKSVYKMALKIDADVYHIHDPELLPYGVKLKKLGKKVIFDSHEHYRTQIREKPYLPKWMALMISYLYGVYEDSVLRKIDGVVFPCTINGLFPFKCKNVAVVNNVPRLSEFYDKYEVVKEKDTRTVCLVGSLTYERGLIHAIKATYEADATLFAGGEISLESIKKEINVMPESSAVVFLGRLDRDQVLETMKNSQIGLSAELNVGQYSIVDTLATKCYEYMSMGLPIIMNKRAFNQTIVDKYNVGITVNPENITEYATAIKYLLDNPDVAHDMGANGRKLIKDTFNWEKEEHNLFQLYEKILGCDH